MMKKSDKKIKPFERLRDFAIPHKNGYIKSIILSILSVICGLIPYYIVAQMVISLLDGDKALESYFIGCSIAAISLVLRAVFAGLSTSMSHEATFSVLSEVRHEIAQKLAKVPMGFVIEYPSGKLKNSMIERVEQMEVPLAHAVPEMTSNLLVPFCIILYLLVLKWPMALASLVTFPIAMICYKLMIKEYPKRYGEVVKAGKHMSATMVEYIGGIEVIKTFNQSGTSYKKFTHAVNNNTKLVLSWMEATNRYSAVMMSSMPAVLIGVLPVGMVLYHLGFLSVADFITVILLSLGIMAPLMSAVFFTDDIAKINTIMGEIGQILDEPDMIRPKKYCPIEALDINLSNVTFGYNDELVLKGINLSIKKGSVTALVGESGSGKSTIAKLITGFWDVNGGEISIGGYDVKSIPLKQLSELISYVSQDNYLFNDTIANNIRMGNENATDNAVIKIAKASGCHEFITKLENSYNTVVGGAGGHLSGGERQRVSIARAMMKNAPIIILDEATSYADPENEAVIQEAVSRLAMGKTLIVIAHRLSTITNADQIIVMSKGAIMARGTHEELLDSCEHYKDMWQSHIGVKDSMEVSYV